MAKLAAKRLRILDYDDPNFDPRRTFDEGHGSALVVDPYPAILGLLAQGPVHKLDLAEMFGAPRDQTMAGLEHYTVLNYGGVRRAFSDSESFSPRLYKRNLGLAFGESIIVAMDDPDHRKLRNLVQKAFSPNELRRRAELVVTPVMNRLIDSFADKGRADLVGDFALHFPFHTIAAICALPEDEWPLFHRLAMGLTCISFDFPHAMEASQKLWDYFAAVLDEYRAHPGDDMISTLATAEIDGERLSDAEVVTFLRFLLNAGGDTTYRGFANMMTGLLTHPEQLEQVRADRSLIDKAMDEGLRWQAPILSLTRTPRRDLELEGVMLPEGACLHVCAASANRDPAAFEDAGRFDIHRAGPKPMSFGFGPHLCVGQPLARLEMRTALNALLDRLPNMRLDPSTPTPQIVGLGMRAPAALPVVFD